MRTRSLLSLSLWLAAASWLMASEAPGPKARETAAGNLSGLPPVEREAFSPDAAFELMTPPEPGDWLAVHDEPGQTFEAFRKSLFNRPGKRENVIYLQPLSDFSGEKSPSLKLLAEYATLYFQMETRVLSTVPDGKRRFTSRTNPRTQNRQILTGDVLDFLKERLPGDAFCLLGITMEDLYPDPAWNFVFGQASLRGRVGIYSFARYDPTFYGEQGGQRDEKLLLHRGAKVLVHETGHMFGVRHCIYYKCVMNGSNHLRESDRQPLHLCPVCLRKLHYSTGFDVLARYEVLRDFYQDVGFQEEAAWIRQRLKTLRDGRPSR